MMAHVIGSDRKVVAGQRSSLVVPKRGPVSLVDFRRDYAKSHHAVRHDLPVAYRFLPTFLTCHFRMGDKGELQS
jgi:hypothetical protein